MKAVFYLKPGLKIMDVPEPQISNQGDIKIKVAYASICGSDGHTLEGAYDQVIKHTPFPMGHESSGVIVELGESAVTKGLKVGDRVTFYFNKYCGKCYYCRNGQENMCTNIMMTTTGMSEYTVIDEQQVYRIPNDIPLHLACLAEPVSVALRGIERTGIKAGNSVAIFGAGAIGLLTLQLAYYSGANPIVIIEPMEKKRKIALEMKADYAMDPADNDFRKKAEEITGGHGFDVVLECAGTPSAAEQAFENLGKAGVLVYTSTHHPDFRMPLNLYKLWEKEAAIFGVFQSPYLMNRAISILPRLNLEKIITAKFPFIDAKEAFKAQKTGEHPRVILEF